MHRLRYEAEKRLEYAQLGRQAEDDTAPVMRQVESPMSRLESTQTTMFTVRPPSWLTEIPKTRCLTQK